MDKLEIVNNLYFGNVDSESEEDLDKIFIQTNDFDKFLDEKTSVVIGAKGAGKSALFRLFAYYESEARKMSNNKLANVILISGTGFKDIPNMDDSTIFNDMKEDNIDFQAAWNIYIMYKLVYQLYMQEHIVASDNCKKLLIKEGLIKDERLIGKLIRIYEKLIGEAPNVDEISFSDFSVKVSKNKKASSNQVLKEINDKLEQEGKKVWILLDKIDELFSDKSEIRVKCIEGLFLTLIDFQSRYSNIKLKIFVRSDIWSELNFVNKSHLADKQVKLEWNSYDLKRMIVKRGCLNDKIKEYVRVEGGIQDIEGRIDEVFDLLFAKKPYSGSREALTINHMIDRIEDGQGGRYPRELINFCNEAVNSEKETMRISGVSGSMPPVITGNSILKAFPVVSKNKVQTYLSEFGALREHFKRFEGQTKATFTKAELIDLMRGLQPEGDDMLRQLYETGILRPNTSSIIASANYEVPRLFRIGLGMVIKGRP